MKSPLDVAVEPRFYLQEQMQEHLRDHYLELTPDTKFVRWLRDNPKHPRNWPTNRKIYDTALVCLLDLVMYGCPGDTLRYIDTVKIYAN
jgi:hypothetical protein